MRSNPPSAVQVEASLKRFVPPYCANPKCTYHFKKNLPSDPFFFSRGKRRIARFPYVTMRYSCKSCFCSFSSSFFSLIYRDRLNDNYEIIFKLHRGGFTHLQIARELNCSEPTIRQRISKMSRWIILRQAEDLSANRIQEPIVFDGLENFSYSQYDPNNINHAVGKESLFTYDFSFSSMNRKGRMSLRQKKKKKRLEEEFGPYPKGEIHRGAKKVFERLLLKNDNFTLYTDNHYAYREVLRNEKFDKVTHCITPAKKYRNYRNNLFAVNHLDMLSRHHLCAFKRETIAFSKHSVAMQENFILFMGFKNYMRPKFTKKQKRDPMSNKASPAMVLGLTKKIFNFKEMFKTRITKHQIELNEDMLKIFERRDPTSRRKIKAYVGI